MLHQINRRRGFSLIELLIVISIILIIITVAVPKFQKAQMGARELGAIKGIQTIHQAQVQYQSQFGRYANSLQELGPPASGPATPSAADLIGNDLSGGEKGQYKYTLTANAGGYVTVSYTHLRATHRIARRTTHRAARRPSALSGSGRGRPWAHLTMAQPPISNILECMFTSGIFY